MKILFLILSLASGLSQGAEMFNYDPYFNLPQRPFPVEFLLEVEKVKAISVTPGGIKSASILETTYTQEAECRDEKNKKVEIRFTQKDFTDLNSVQVGDTLAAFGLENSKKILFRIHKYHGAKDKIAIEKWFRDLK